MTITVEVFSSPGCGKCAHAKAALRHIAEEFGQGRISWREVDILQEMDYAVQLGVLSTPAIAVDGKLEFTGLTSEKKLRIYLRAKLAQQAAAPT